MTKKRIGIFPRNEGLESLIAERIRRAEAEGLVRVEDTDEPLFIQRFGGRIRELKTRPGFVHGLGSSPAGQGPVPIATGELWAEADAVKAARAAQDMQLSMIPIIEGDINGE